jgi:SAM-dependent methyltransferase
LPRTPQQPEDAGILTIAATTHPLIHWFENGAIQSALWRSESGNPPPRQLIIVDDGISADAAYRFAREGTALLWPGDFQNARQLLHALMRRVEARPPPLRQSKNATSAPLAEAFNLHRHTQARRAQLLGKLLIKLDMDYRVPLRRAPDLREACIHAYGPTSMPSVVSLRELQGLIGAHEWRKKGVAVLALGNRIYPHYGVFAPIRGEYVNLVAETPLPTTTLAFDIGTGTGVLAAVLAQRGVARVVATDQDPRALACARENMMRLGYAKQVEVIKANMFPAGRAPLVVCNPPWVPAQPSSSIEFAVYDPDSRMLNGFLNGLAAHLTPGGEGWLVLSDLAEHLGLRTRAELLASFRATGLKVAGRFDVRPRHPRAADPSDPLHQARAAEVTSLWRLIAG